MLSIQEINLLKSQNEALKKQNRELQEELRQLKADCKNILKQVYEKTQAETASQRRFTYAETLHAINRILERGNNDR